jgi:glyoxylase I family protein
MSTFGAIHHLDLNVSDLDLSGRFYERVLSCMGYRRTNLSVPGEPAGFDWVGPADSGRFSLGLYAAQRQHYPHDRYAPGIHHVAFRARDRERVDQLYDVLIEMNAEVLDAPREYPEYEPDYYAVFFLDPDGIKLEYVFIRDAA